MENTLFRKKSEAITKMSHSYTQLLTVHLTGLWYQWPAMEPNCTTSKLQNICSLWAPRKSPVCSPMAFTRLLTTSFLPTLQSPVSSAETKDGTLQSTRYMPKIALLWGQSCPRFQGELGPRLPWDLAVHQGYQEKKVATTLYPHFSLFGGACASSPDSPLL